MEQSRRRRVALVVALGFAVLFGAMGAVAGRMGQPAAAWEFFSTGVILLAAGLVVFAARPKADGPWWNRPIRVRTRKQLIAVGIYLVVMLALIFFFTSKLAGLTAGFVELAVFGLLALAAFVAGWRRTRTS